MPYLWKAADSFLRNNKKSPYYRNTTVAAQNRRRSTYITYYHPSHLHTGDLHQTGYVSAHLSSRFIEVDSINFIELYTAAICFQGNKCTLPKPHSTSRLFGIWGSLPLVLHGASTSRCQLASTKSEQIWGAFLEKIIPIRGEKCEMKQAGSRLLARRWDLCKAPAPISFTPRTAGGWEIHLRVQEESEGSFCTK